jgi:hypothetical protein
LPLGAAFHVRPCAAALILLASVAAPAADLGSEIGAAFEPLLSEQGHWRGLVSPYTYHFHPSDEHKPVWALGIERQLDNHWLYGGSFFSNSFGQPSGYFYLGRQHPGLLGLPPDIYLQWSVGLLYGYVGQYKDKVPLNYKGFSPGAVLSLGWQATPRFATQLNLLGDAGVMLQFSYRYD